MEGKRRRMLPLHGFRIAEVSDPELMARLPFLKGGPVDITLEAPVTFLVGENGCGKTSLLESLAARCAIRPSGGDSYRDYEDDRPGTAASDDVTVILNARRISGWFMRADRLHVATARPDALRMGHADEWRPLGEQSRGESMLSLVSAEVDRGRADLFILDEPDTGLSPSRQVAMLRLLDEIARAGRQALVATHSVILMSYPDADILYVDPSGIYRRRRDELDHWQIMASLMRNPQRFAHNVLDDD